MRKCFAVTLVGCVLKVSILLGLSGCGVYQLQHNTDVLSGTEKGASKQELLEQLYDPIGGSCRTTGIVNNRVIERCDYIIEGFSVDSAMLNHVFFHDNKYIGHGHRNGILSQYADDIQHVNNKRSLIFIYRYPTEKEFISGVPKGYGREIDVYANDELVGKLDYEGGLLWDYEGLEDLNIKISQDGKVANSVNFTVKPSELYKLGIYMSGELVMEGDRDSVTRVTSTPSGAVIYTGYKKNELHDTGFTTPHNFQRMPTAFKWIPEYFQVKLGNQESEVIFKDNTFGHRDVHIDFNPKTIESKRLEITGVSSPVKQTPEDKAEDKLTRLKKMHDKGFITEDEYKMERVEVLEKF